MPREPQTPLAPIKRVDWLDALRGWAILGVVFVHSAQNVPALSGVWRAAADAGQYGVQLFYVVSALTIGLTYERQLMHDVGTTRASAAWLVKRYFRIAPLYYYGIVLYLLIFAGMRLLGSQLGANSPFDIIANVLFIHSWMPSAQNTVVPGGWSIAVEMCFYLVAPILFLVLRTSRASLIALIGTTALVFVLDRAVAQAMTGTSAVANNSFLYFWFPSQLPVFMAGVALYRCAGRLLWTHDAPPAGISIVALVGAALFGALGLALGAIGNLDHSLASTAMGIAFCGLALGCRYPAVEAVLVNRATAWLGQISYSVYINHFAAILTIRFLEKRVHVFDQLPGPVALLAIVGAAFVITLPMSLMTRRLIEAPGIDLGHRLAGAVESYRRRGELIAVSEREARRRSG